MLDGEVVLPIVAQTLVEGGILLGGYLAGVASPKRLSLVEFLVLNGRLLNLLGLLLFLLLIVDLLNLRLVGVLLSLLLLLVIFNLLQK